MKLTLEDLLAPASRNSLIQYIHYTLIKEIGPLATTTYQMLALHYKSIPNTEDFRQLMAAR
jgi:hypothetical protein